MRVWGRVTNQATGAKQWVLVETQPNGSNDYVYVTALIQCLKLSINESPFWSNWGIPAAQSVVQQVFPDYYVALMQQRYAQYFASLKITKTPSTPSFPNTPTYRIDILSHQGTALQFSVSGIPQ